MTLTPKQFEIGAALDRDKGAIFGLTPIPSPPRCDKPSKGQGRCPQTATWQAADGGKFCRIHALQWAEARDQ